MDELSDGELARAARASDASCLGLLLERHRADLRAVAVALLGYGPDAEDAVQDAMLTALSSLGSLRDPDTVGAWLPAIVRNACRMHLRMARPQVPLDFDVAGTESVEDVLDRHALGDWVWHAIGKLSEPWSSQVPDPAQVAGRKRNRECSRTTRCGRSVGKADMPRVREELALCCFRLH
jgi:DNA-directed RNA polymerase specialized sigma24 family protein